LAQAAEVGIAGVKQSLAFGDRQIPDASGVDSLERFNPAPF
jgi:hypothetical protein